MSIITLLTDFGTRDWFAGAMKGVIWSINPRVRIADITHEIESGQVSSAAFVLQCGYGCFPAGTIHVAVVDPGVGSERSAILVQTARYYFIGPDNGILSLALRHETIRQIRRFENTQLFRKPVSRTFHGRDIFAPVAARLSRGLALDRVGPRQEDYRQLSCVAPVKKKGVIEGTTIHIDGFGNVITNLPADMAQSSRAAFIRVAGCRRSIPVRSFYQAVPAGSPLALAGSHGYLEIAVNGGSAARDLGIRANTQVKLHLR
jgi:hypothetical protein